MKECVGVRLVGSAVAMFPPGSEFSPGSWHVSLYAADKPVPAAFWIVTEGDATNWPCTDYLNDKFTPDDPMTMWDRFEAWIEDGGILFSDS